MSQVYDNWDRLVRATLLREELRLTGLRTPSDLSQASTSLSSNFNSSSRRALSPVTFGDPFDYNQILRATNFLSQSNLIRNGRSGDLYQGVLKDGSRVVVKKIDSSLPEKEFYFNSELELFSKPSQQSRLVPLIGHCLTDLFEKFLVYKFMTHKDLSSSLFRKIVFQGDQRLQSLDWITRLKIAVGAAEVLCYLHHECVPPLIHRDIQASSFLLDDYYEVRLGSLGAVGRYGTESNHIHTSNPTDSTPGTSGKYTNFATRQDDVYSFGMVLLELVTGKIGVSANAKQSKTRDQWTAKTLTRISIEDKELVSLIVDPSLVVDDDDLLMEIWAMAIIAKACLNPQPSKRPLMTHVLKALKNPLKVVNGEDSPNNSAKTAVPTRPAGYGIWY